MQGNDMDKKYDNSGAIFVNDRKEKDTHPDRSGSAMIDGVEYWVSGWIKNGKSGKPFMSLSFKKKDVQRGCGPIDTGNTYADDLSDEIPF